MKRHWNGSSWLACMLCGTALVLTSLGTVRGAVVDQWNSDIRLTLESRTADGFVIDWNEKFVMQPTTSGKPGRALDLPQLAPDKPQAVDIAATKEEAAAGRETTEENTPNAEGYSEYYRYKYGVTGDYYGENADNPADDDSTDATTPNDGDTSDDDESADDESTGSEDSSEMNAEEESATDGASETGENDVQDSKADPAGQSSDARDYTPAADETEDYMKYKYGYFGRHFGNEFDANPDVPQGTDAASTSETDNSTGTEPSDAMTEESSDGYSDEESTDESEGYSDEESMEESEEYSDDADDGDAYDSNDSAEEAEETGKTTTTPGSLLTNLIVAAFAGWNNNLPVQCGYLIAQFDWSFGMMK